MEGVTVSSGEDENDYLNKLSRVLLWHRPFTYRERLLIVLIVSAFVSLVGFTLICLICLQSALRKRYVAKKKLAIEQQILMPSAPRKDILGYTPTLPNYDSIVKADDAMTFNELRKSRYLDLARTASCGTASDSDGVQSNGVSINFKLYLS